MTDDDLGTHDACSEAVFDMAAQLQRNGYTWSLTEEPTKLMSLRSSYRHPGALANDFVQFTGSDAVYSQLTP